MHLSSKIICSFDIRCFWNRKIRKNCLNCFLERFSWLKSLLYGPILWWICPTFVIHNGWIIATSKSIESDLSRRRILTIEHLISNAWLWFISPQKTTYSFTWSLWNTQIGLIELIRVKALQDQVVIVSPTLPASTLFPLADFSLLIFLHIELNPIEISCSIEIIWLILTILLIDRNTIL